MNPAQRITELEAELAQLKNEQAQSLEIDDGTTFTPEYDDQYYSLSSGACVEHNIWLYVDDDKQRLIAGNVFRTQESAENARQKRLAVVRVTRAIYELNLQSSDNGMYSIYYYLPEKCFSCNTYGFTVFANLFPMCKNAGIACKTINSHEADLKLIFGVE